VSGADFLCRDYLPAPVTSTSNSQQQNLVLNDFVDAAALLVREFVPSDVTGASYAVSFLVPALFARGSSVQEGCLARRKFRALEER